MPLEAVARRLGHEDATQADILAMSNHQNTASIWCSICGGSTFTARPVLWDSLVDEWQLSPLEREYIDRQQGKTCVDCGCNLRSIALANAVRSALGLPDTLQAITSGNVASNTKCLEINEAGNLSPYLSRMSGYTFGAYPLIDMHALPYAGDSFDLVVHSDTLEHVSNPIHALVECRRVLRPGGRLCFTVPAVVGRMTRSRTGLPRSYHGDPVAALDDYAVHTEFGADMWTYAIVAGFSAVTIHAVAYPDATAMSALK
jgi:SAM-dependent methyltransferase